MTVTVTASIAIATMTAIATANRQSDVTITVARLTAVSVVAEVIRIRTVSVIGTVKSLRVVNITRRTGVRMIRGAPGARPRRRQIGVPKTRSGNEIGTRIGIGIIAVAKRTGVVAIGTETTIVIAAVVIVDPHLYQTQDQNLEAAVGQTVAVDRTVVVKVRKMRWSRKPNP
jgi:hypothetical protein